MTLTSLIILLSIGLVAFQFWRLRGIAEFSDAYAKQYCDNNNLQFMSLARKNTKLTGKFGRLDWKIDYDFEFSSNGEDAYIGKICCVGRRVIDIHLPVYKIS